MEEILASIRRIISEDETPATPEGETAAAPVEGEAEAEPEMLAEPEVEAEPEAEPESEPGPEMLAEAAPADPEPEEDVLDLTEPVVSVSANESIGDLDVFTPSPKAEPAPMPAASAPMTDEESLVSAPAAAAAVSAFGQLASRVGMPPASQTLDDVVRELLRPLLKDWLDANLAGIVQAKVEEEVERLARRRGA
jgi:cell pole-organizing protein PopZ